MTTNCPFQKEQLRLWNDNLVTADYYGGTIKYGKIIATLKDDELNMLYQCLTTDNQLKAGKAIAKISWTEKGKMKLNLNWEWLRYNRQKQNMKQTIIYFAWTILTLTSCNNKIENIDNNMATTNERLTFKSDYSEVNGMKMYYEIHGKGKPLVLIHGGGSTIQTTFEKVIPMFAKNRMVIAVELQAHGRTSDRNADLTFEQDADDIATLLKNLNIAKADFFGFSNGGTTTLQIAIRHPEIVNKIILGSALAKRNGVPDCFWGFMEQAKLENMPEPLKAGYKKVAADTNGLQVMHDRDAKRMINFKDIPDEQIKSIKARTLIIIGDKDIITPEHAIELHRQIVNSELAIIPGGHGEYIGEITTTTPDFKECELIVPMIEKFLNFQ